MALIKCPECGKEISDKSEKCLSCGYPISQNQQSETSKSEFADLYDNPIIKKQKKEVKPKKHQNELSTARLVISILMLVFSAIVLFQSCAVGVVNVIEDNGNTDGGTGLLVFLCMIVFGIIGIATKNTKSYKCLLTLATFSCIIFLLCTFAYEGIFEDLKVWGWLFAIYSLIFTFSGSAVMRNKKVKSNV